ncbi:MAG: hypothetical protein O3A01_03595 [bacterium]|nr:hypothetical protein [bacterium]
MNGAVNPQVANRNLPGVKLYVLHLPDGSPLHNTLDFRCLSINDFFGNLERLSLGKKTFSSQCSFFGIAEGRGVHLRGISHSFNIIRYQRADFFESQTEGYQIEYGLEGGEGVSFCIENHGDRGVYVFSGVAQGVFKVGQAISMLEDLGVLKMKSDVALPTHPLRQE